MISTNGQLWVKRFMALQVPAIAQSIGFGIGDKTEALGDTRLQFEVGRSEINLVSYDFDNNKLIFKASVPDEFGGSIYEVALYSQPAFAYNGEFTSRILTTFDSSTESWVDATDASVATFIAENSRIADDSLRHTPAANGGKTDSLKNIALDLSGYSSSDTFTLALSTANTNTSSVRARFLTDTSNYYEVNFGAPLTGYRVMEATKGSAVATGQPSWSNITELRITTNSGASGASQVDYDGLRIEDTDSINSDDVMVSREVLAVPFVKVPGMTQEIEFRLDVSV